MSIVIKKVYKFRWKSLEFNIVKNSLFIPNIIIW